MEHDDPRLTTRELQAMSASKTPAEIEGELRAQAQRLTVAIAAILLAVVLATGAGLFYTIRTLSLVESVTGEPARERQAETIADLIGRVDCANRENLEEAVNALLEEIAAENGSREPARIRLEVPEECVPPELPSTGPTARQ